MYGNREIKVSNYGESSYSYFGFGFYKKRGIRLNLLYVRRFRKR